MVVCTLMYTYIHTRVIKSWLYYLISNQRQGVLAKGMYRWLLRESPSCYNERDLHIFIYVGTRDISHSRESINRLSKILSGQQPKILSIVLMIALLQFCMGMQKCNSSPLLLAAYFLSQYTTRITGTIIPLKFTV